VEGYRLASSLESMLEMSKPVVGTLVGKVAVGAADVVSWASFQAYQLNTPAQKDKNDHLLARMVVKYKRERKLVSTRCIVRIESSVYRFLNGRGTEL
jgi:hypothetical protein